MYFYAQKKKVVNKGNEIQTKCDKQQKTEATLGMKPKKLCYINLN